MVTGQLLIANTLAYVLIDSRETHSFASCKFVECVSHDCDVLRQGFSTSLLSREILFSSHWLRAIPMIILGIELYVVLVILNMHDYNVILGMDFLEKYNATIECQSKKIIFMSPGEVEFEYIGENGRQPKTMISAMKARKLLANGCVGNLANIVDLSREEKLKPEDVPVVQDFVEVFPDELPDLPPSRAISFEIELMPGTVPISKAPYHMALTELKEL